MSQTSPFEAFNSVISAEDALRVSLLDHDVSSGKVLSKWNTSEIEIRKAAADTEGRLVGIFAKDHSIASAIRSHLPDGASGIDLTQIPNSRIDERDYESLVAIVAHIDEGQEEDESALEQLLAISDHLSVLFLCEPTLTTRCDSKVEAFLHEQLAH